MAKLLRPILTKKKIKKQKQSGDNTSKCGTPRWACGNTIPEQCDSKYNVKVNDFVHGSKQAAESCIRKNKAK